MEQTTRTGHQPTPRPHGFGVDEPFEQRPGVPMETEPAAAEGTHREMPLSQRARRTHPHRAGLERLTPVFGTAQPPRGPSGLMRRFAYRIPEHKARHWALLLAADRVDVLEGRLGDVLGRQVERAGLPGIARQVRKNPTRALLVTGAAGWMVGRMLR